MNLRGPDFLALQRSFFSRADQAHFRWQSQNPFISRTERELLRGFPIIGKHVALEVGCGEGGNLANLLMETAQGGTLIVGLDLFEEKVAFAKRHVPRARFVCGDASRLPFPDQLFDAVLCRDLLHHLEQREIALAELRRVCKSGGDLWIVEPNGLNPLMRVLALLRPHERGLLRNSTVTLQRLVAPHFSDFRIETRQPMPIYRVLLHYQFGLPQLGSSRLVELLMDAWERAVSWLLPRRWWSYIVVKVKP